MGDSIDHWATVCTCNLCGKIPENVPLYHCPFKHQYCSSCFQELQKKCVEGDGCYCEVCKTSVNFEETKLNPDFLRKLKSNPGIGRPFRYSSNPLSSSVSANSALNNDVDRLFARPVTVEKLFGLPKSDLKLLFERTNNGDSVEEKPSEILKRHESVGRISISHSSPFSSHKPVPCPHHPCNRMIAISAFANHFRYEHPELKKYTTDRNKEVIMPFDIRLCESEKSLCLAILTIYENNKVDLLRSKSTHGVIRTCRKFCQKVPIGSFWVMLTGSKSRKKSNSYFLIWLFSNSCEQYQSTIELSSKNDSVSISSFSSINSIPEHTIVKEIAKNLNCLYVSYGSAVGLLGEGRELNLRIAVH